MSNWSATLRQQVLDWLEDHVSEPRLKHILRVEQMAIALAEAHQQDRDCAAQAGLMHDLAKSFKPQRLLDMAQANGVALDPVDEADPHLLHATVGAIVAQEEFGIQDEAVLEAIANHTLGQPGMSPLSCIVFLADSLEPGRGNTSELHYLRQVSYDDLRAAVWQTCDYSFKYLIENQRLIHPRTLMTRNYFLQASRDKAYPGRLPHLVNS